VPVESGRDSDNVIHADVYARKGAVEPGIAEGKDAPVEADQLVPAAVGGGSHGDRRQVRRGHWNGRGEAAEAEDPPTRGSSATPTRVASPAPIRSSFVMVPP